jgi:hypothetical protein
VLYRLTQDPQAAVVMGRPVALLHVTPPPIAPPTDFFAVRGLIFRARPMVYRIDTTLLNGKPALVLQDFAPLDTTQPLQIVAENIVDLQVALGVDGLRTGQPSGTLEETGAAANDDEWVYNFPGEVLPQPLPPGSRIAAVRVTVVARTEDAEQPLQRRPALEDRPAGPVDGHRYRLLPMTVYLRSAVTN